MIKKLIHKSLLKPRIQTISTSTMTACVLEGKNMEMSFQELYIPKPRRNEVLIKANSTGVCHTDIHVMKGYLNFPIPCVYG